MNDVPFSIQKLEGELKENAAKAIPAETDGFVHVGPEKFMLPVAYTDYAEIIYNFEARTDDVFTCTYPRSGTTWTQEMIWLICNDLDYETASNKMLFERFPMLEYFLITI